MQGARSVIHRGLGLFSPPLLKTPQESIPIEKKIKRMEDKRDKTYLKKNSKNKLIKGYEKLNEKKGIND
jgi:hypothetical protein